MVRHAHIITAMTFVVRIEAQSVLYVLPSSGPVFRAGDANGDGTPDVVAGHAAFSGVAGSLRRSLFLRTDLNAVGIRDLAVAQNGLRSLRSGAEGSLLGLDETPEDLR